MQAWTSLDFVPCWIANNDMDCSVVSQLSQSCKHSKSADLLHKSLLSHVWRVPRSNLLSCKHERVWTLCLAELQTMIRIAPLFHNFRNPANIRNPQIYCINRYFLMFGGYQGPTSYHASMNESGLWYPCIIVCAARGNYDRLCHIVCRFVFINHLCVILFFCLDVI